MLVGGGQNPSHGKSEILEKTSGEWVLVKDYPKKAKGVALVAKDSNTIYEISGYGDYSSSRAHRYDRKEDKWTAIQRSPHGGANQACEGPIELSDGRRVAVCMGLQDG